MTIQENINKFQELFFNLFIVVSYILTFIGVLGLYAKAPELLNNIDYYVKIYVCLFLIYRFNPLRKEIEITNLDRKISFNAGLFIFTTTFINSILQKYYKEIVMIIDKYL